jgi:hypothetical protein
MDAKYGILKRNIGIAPELRRELLLRDKAASGDIVLSCSLSTFGASATTATEAFSKATTWKLKTASGDLHDWFCGPLDAAVADSAVTGIIHKDGALDTTVWFNGGVTVVTLSSTTGPLNAATTASLRVGGSILGQPVTTVSFVITFS